MDSADDVSVDLLRQLRDAAQLQHAVMTKVWQRETEHDLHPAAGRLLGEIARLGEVRMSELAKRRLVDISVISRQVGQLVAAGLVTRRPAPEDGRASLVACSPDGEQALERWRAHYVALSRRAFADWTDDEVNHLVSRLAEANSALRELVGGADCEPGLGGAVQPDH